MNTTEVAPLEKSFGWNDVLVSKFASVYGHTNEDAILSTLLQLLDEQKDASLLMQRMESIKEETSK